MSMSSRLAWCRTQSSWLKKEVFMWWCAWTVQGLRGSLFYRINRLFKTTYGWSGNVRRGWWSVRWAFGRDQCFSSVSRRSSCLKSSVGSTVPRWCGHSYAGCKVKDLLRLLWGTRSWGLTRSGGGWFRRLGITTWCYWERTSGPVMRS